MKLPTDHAAPVIPSTSNIAPGMAAGSTPRAAPYATAEDAQAQIDKPTFMGIRGGWRVRRHAGRYTYGTVAA